MKHIVTHIILGLVIIIDSSAQNYFNKIIPFEISNPNPSKLIINENTAFIASINFINSKSASTITTVNLDDFSYDMFHNIGFGFGRGGLFLINKSFYGCGNNFIDKSISLISYNNDFNIKTQNNYKLESNSYGVTATSKLNDDLFIGTVFDLDNGERREVNLKRLDTLGNEKWSLNLGQEDRLTYCWEIDTTRDKHLLVSTRVVYNDIFGGFSQLLKMDTMGSIKWRYEATESSIIGDPSHNVAELSNGNVILSTIVDRIFDIDYIVNDWYRAPTKYTWVDSEGNYMRDTIINSPRLNHIESNNVIPGRGDYFFSIGTWQDQEQEEDYLRGFIFKMSNEGEMIWKKRYIHHEFKNEDYNHRIRDIVEEENGDIVVLGTVNRPGEKIELWLMRINEHGCFGEKSCADDVIFSTSTNNQEIKNSRLKVYPNPAFEDIYFDSQKRITSLTIVDIAGKLILKKEHNEIKTVSIIGINDGIYFLKAIFQDGTQTISKIYITN